MRRAEQRDQSAASDFKPSSAVDPDPPLPAPAGVLLARRRFSA
jgi:hypothetical protein